MRWLLYLIIVSLIFGCAPEKTEKIIEKASDKVISRDEAVGSLPCFRCHSYQKFSSQPQKGIFSHSIHMDTGYHCNQCHEIKGHKNIFVNRDICNNCHNMKAISFKKTAFPSRFDHMLHSKIFGCKDCHPKIFIMKAGASYVTMKDIYNGAYCGACHDGKKAFSSSDCAKCHEMKSFNKELVYKVEGLGNVVFSHKFHTSAFSCADCHPKLFDMKKTKGKMTKDEMYKGKFCGACHNGSMASPLSDCGKCHKG